MTLTKSQIEALYQVRHHIESGPGLYTTIKELSDLSGLSEAILTKGFKYLFQTTIFQYHLSISMEYAKGLLEEGTQLKQVALRLHYQSTANFNRAFVKVFGKLPSTFRGEKIVQRK